MTVAFVTNPNHAAHAVDGHVERPERLDAALDMLRDVRPARIACTSSTVPRRRASCCRRSTRSATSSGSTKSALKAAAGSIPTRTACPRPAPPRAPPSAPVSPPPTPSYAATRPRRSPLSGHPATTRGRSRRWASACSTTSRSPRVTPSDSTSVGRVAIVDIDVHHGNGTQDAFYDDPTVLYVSTHQYPFYPGTGRADELGAGDARGTNVNIPLPAGCGDAEYAAVFDQLVEPIVRRYQPELLFVSLGFDAHFLDPLAMMSLSVDGYGALMSRLRALAEELCGGKLVVALEGGYDLDAIAWGVRRTVEVLLGRHPHPRSPRPLARPRAPDISALLNDARDARGPASAPRILSS